LEISSDLNWHLYVSISHLSPKATPIFITLSQHLPPSFFARPTEVVALEFIGCLLVKCQASGELLWGVIVETEAYSQDEPACHGYRRRTPSNSIKHFACLREAAA